eukprot:CAMPEP_0197306436 /NCGR_PEP_ID=MMETSP0891-20130614/3315_1 /TAXON_ID=44058 ORGANISM="Aureoumbra lagunensis, Strain CCMP1510" /NCGR_SAMPLE_ID=MMETSP0891 /ASSEMBLY_ACC=CAM_ASM_000534 /LENGTH=133 /DNA_ID=CAMNT_0042788675 /DNA_START=270 /DNA_END=668 /DNA_ORIENTATION=+
MGDTVSLLQWPPTRDIAFEQKRLVSDALCAFFFKFVTVLATTIAEAGAIPALVNLLTSGTAAAKEKAAAALWNLAINDENKVFIAEAGAIPALVNNLLTSGTAIANKNAAGALGTLAVNDEDKVAIAEAGAIP